MAYFRLAVDWMLLYLKQHESASENNKSKCSEVS